jgi:hypothetical protein
MKYKYMNSEVEVIAEGPDGNDVKTQFETCMKQAAVKALVAGLTAGWVTGGMAGLSAAMTTLTAMVDSCVEAALKKAVEITAHVNHITIDNWDWE